MAIAAVNAPITPRAPIPSGGGRVVPGNFGNPRPVNSVPSNVVPGNFGGPRPVATPPSNVVPGNFGGPRPVATPPSNVVPGNFGGPRPVTPVAQPATYTGPRPVNPTPSTTPVGGMTPGSAAAGLGQALGEAATKEFFDWAYPKADLPPGSVGPLPGPEIPNPAREGVNPGLADAMGIPPTIPGPSLPVYPNQTDPSAIPPGPQIEAPIPAQPGEPGSVAGAVYEVAWSIEVFPSWAKEETIHSGLVGPVSSASGTDYFSSGLPFIQWREFIGANGASVRVTVTRWFSNGVIQYRNGSGGLRRADGGTDPPAVPEQPAVYAPNPARARPRGVPALPRPNLPPGADPLPFPLRAPTPSPSPFPFAPAAPAPRTNPDPTAPPSPARPLDPNPAPTPTPNPNPQPQPNPAPNTNPTPNYDPESPTVPAPPLPQTQPNPTPGPPRPNLYPPFIVPGPVITPSTPFMPEVNPTPWQWPETPVKLRPGEKPNYNTPTNPDLSGDPADNPLVEIVPEIIKQTNNIRRPNACRYDSKNIAGKCDKIKDVVDDNKKILYENLDRKYEGEINLSPCPQEGDDDPPQDVRSSEAEGLPGIDAKIELALDGIAALWELLRCQDDNEQPLLVMPEWWQVRVGAQRPQLILIWADKDEKKAWGNIRRQCVIPHFDAKLRASLTSILPKHIDKGPHQGIYTLADNSKIINFFKDKTEAERVLKTFERLIKRSQKTGDMKVGEIKGSKSREFVKIRLYPFEARYFASGQGQGTPNWIERFH